MSTSENPEGSLALTSRRSAAVAVLAGLAAGYLSIGAFDLADRPVPFVPWSLAVMCLVLAGASAAHAVVLRRQVRLTRADVDPDAAVRSLVLGKTMLSAGLLLAGAMVGYVLRFIGSWDVPGPHERVVRGLACLVGGVLMAAAGALLERACIAPRPSDETD